MTVAEISILDLVKHFCVEKLLEVVKLSLVFQILISFENGYRIVAISCNSCYSKSFYSLPPFKLEDQILMSIGVAKFSEKALSTMCLHTD